MNEKPRLLVLASTYPRWKGDSEPGFVHELSRRLTDHFDVTVVCPAAPGVAHREEMDGVHVRRFRYAPDRLQTLVNDGGIVTNLKSAAWKWALVPFFFLSELMCTWKAIREIRPDVVHAHWLVPQGLIMALLSKLSRRTPPFVITSHGADLYALKSWPFKSLKRFAARGAAGLTVVSSAMLKELERQGIDHPNARVEPMGVDLQTRFVPDDTVKRSTSEILFVGRLVEKKGLRYLIDAMPLILEKHPAASLTVAGFGREGPALRRQTEALGLTDKIRFLGAVPQEALPENYRQAAVFVAPFIEAAGGDQEGLGLVTVEAIGCGCPVVVSDLPAVAEVVNDRAMRVEPGNPVQLAGAVARVLSLPRPECEKMVAKLRQGLLNWLDWASRDRAYASILKAIANSEGGRSGCQ